MALTDVYFEDPRDAADLHVVRGVPSPRLDQKLRIRDDAMSPSIVRGDSPPPHVDVRFRAHIEPELPLGLEFLVAHGIRVHTGFDSTHGTGVITVEPAPPGGRRLHNFLLTASAFDRNTGTKIERTIRVHVHDAITRAWMTPSTLGVRPDGGLCRFSLFAEFDDQVIGDISNWASFAMTWSIAVTPPAGPADIQMYNVSNGWFQGRTAGAQAVMSVDYAGLTWPEPRPSGRVLCVEEWATTRELTWIAGRDPAKWQDVPNVLFLPDGFVDGEEELFTTLVRGIVRKLRKSSVLRPFDLLHEEMNFWTTFVPSPQAGVNVLYEVYDDFRYSAALYGAVPFAIAPADDDRPWSLEGLIHEVGLPVEADRVRDLDGADGLLAAWQHIYGPKVTKPRVKDSWRDWRALARRTLLNEQDTLFGLSLGSRPRAEGNTLVRSLHLRSEERVGTTALDNLLVNLRYKGQPVGTVWRIAGPNSPFLPGKDTGLVCILSRTRLIGGANLDSYYTSSLYRADAQLIRPGAAGGVDIVPLRLKLRSMDLPPGEEKHPYVDVDDPPFEAVGTVAHETAHSLHLGDEYGEKDTRTLKDYPPASGAALATWHNLQDQQSLLTPTGRLNATWAKWAPWHRIEKAGVLAEDPKPIQGAFRLTLRPGHATAFRKDDLVRLRRRPIGPDTLVSHVLRIKETPAGNQADLDVTVLYEGWTSPIHFKAGSVLMKMVRWPFRGLGTTLGDELMLMARNIREHIDTTGLPLNAPPGRALSACDLDNSDQQSARNLPDGLPKCQPRNRSRIVGLFEGGSLYHCGVYHPTGACVMRSRGSDALIPFCPVCRYVLVDLIDPTKHGIIDRDHAKIYPDPRT
jgi:hypothetical protein